ncbi:MAG TPA: hypothetical protein VLM91_15365 [Candidatus Methylomirabilis sp.]|nr:hypothetical protein [Candidatus Methylomirabilis sp.]
MGLLKEGVASGKLALSPAEGRWLQRIEDALADLPAGEETLLAEVAETYGHLYAASSYGLT